MSDHSLERRLAPHVDPAWVEAFVVEARLRGVLGTVIGDALAEVDAHVVDSGQSAQEAFGDPKDYAHHFPADAAAGTGMGKVVMPPALQALGMMAVLQCVPALRADEPLAVTVGTIALVALLVAAFAALAKWSTPILRVAMSRPVVGAAGFAAFVVAGVAASFIPGTIATISAWWALGVGIALLAVGVMLGIERGERGADADPIVTPGDEPRPANLLTALTTNLIVPVVTGLVAALLLVL